jgi:hypothetical protein
MTMLEKLVEYSQRPYPVKIDEFELGKFAMAVLVKDVEIVTGVKLSPPTNYVDYRGVRFRLVPDFGTHRVRAVWYDELTSSLKEFFS